LTIWFTYEQEENITHLELYIRDWSKDQDHQFGLGAFLLLDSALGEFVVETRVGGVGRHALPADTSDLLPFREIVNVVTLAIA
jgi:hypothetical protein